MSNTSGKNILKAVHKFNRTQDIRLSELDQRTGCLILKAINSQDAVADVTRYLRQYAKNISPESVPRLLQELPVVLARKVPESTARKVRSDLRELKADAVFIPIVDPSTPAVEHEPEVVKVAEDPAPEPATIIHLHIGPFKVPLPALSLHTLTRLGKELGIMVAMLIAVGLLNFTLASQYLLLGFFTVPTILSAFFFGRNQAVLTAFLSILLVIIVSLIHPEKFTSYTGVGLGGDNQWYHILSWGSILLLTAYLMGRLYELHQQKIMELRRAYQGILLLLGHVITLDDNKEDHCFRVSIYAAKIAREYGMSDDDIADIRSAALLHDIGRPDISREVFLKASFLASESTDSKTEEPNRKENNPLSRILPLLVSNYPGVTDPVARKSSTNTLPVGTQILAIADRYDTLINTKPFTDAPSRKKALEIVINEAGKEFHLGVIKAFEQAVLKGEMSIPDMLL
ncbi:MAG: hypothetical protein CSA33_01490 [Desulfobulbus propionicus]|nr:MAG: hypothetical protein CSA33_01490 [Desulfobulbus propionicus]